MKLTQFSNISARAYRTFLRNGQYLLIFQIFVIFEATRSFTEINEVSYSLANICYFVFLVIKKFIFIERYNKCFNIMKQYTLKVMNSTLQDRIQHENPVSFENPNRSSKKKIKCRQESDKNIFINMKRDSNPKQKKINSYFICYMYGKLVDNYTSMSCFFSFVRFSYIKKNTYTFVNIQITVFFPT